MLKASDILREHFHRYISDRDARPAKQGRVSPSKIAAGCLFSVYCDVTEAPHEEEVRGFGDWVTLLVGHFLHDLLQKFFSWYYESQGIVYLSEHKVDIAENCHGSIDGIVLHPSGHIEVVDYKTCSDSVFTSLGRKAASAYVDQLLLYMHGSNADSGSILYINRSNFKLQEFSVEKDQDRIDELLQRIDTVNRAVDSKTPPPASMYWMGTKKCVKVCAYRKVCPLANTMSNSKL